MHRGQQQPDQQRDNGHHHQQLDQREATASVHATRHANLLLRMPPASAKNARKTSYSSERKRRNRLPGVDRAHGAVRESIDRVLQPMDAAVEEQEITAARVPAGIATAHEPDLRALVACAGSPKALRRSARAAWVQGRIVVQRDRARGQCPVVPVPGALGAVLRQRLAHGDGLRASVGHVGLAGGEHDRR